MKANFGERLMKISVKNTQEIAVSCNETLLKSLTAAGTILEASCGGQGTCGKCKIRLLSGQVMDYHGDLAKPQADGSYLACQVYPLGDIVIDKIDKFQTSQKGEIGNITLGKEKLAPLVKKVVVKPSFPSLDKNFSLQKMISRTLGITVEDIHALKQLVREASQKVEEMTLVLVADKVTSIETGGTTGTLYGVAFDIGTTTVAAMLVDLNKGKVIGAAAETNPQVSYGADVISRIKASSASGGLENLSLSIRECLNNLILRLCITSGIATTDVYMVTVAGNSTMEHLLMGISPAYLTISPYVTTFDYIPPFSPNIVNLNINSGGRVVLLPNIASFVGADTVAAAIAMDQDLTPKLTLMIDLGTNGEMVLGNKDKMVVCSTAAGPAFEGAQLSSGMRAAEGAIDDVIIKDDVYLTTIKQEKPNGICGSGVIKAIAELLKAGVITASGRFVSNSRIQDLPGNLRNRVKDKEGQKEFVLVIAEESATLQDISITQGDIREIQLVKSSICTGAQILMEHFGVTSQEIEQVLIAGAFGNFIELNSALAIGLVPQIDPKKIQPVGNAAGTGAIKALLSNKYLERSYEMAKRADFLELANHPQFQKRFISNLSFPEVINENK